MNLKKIKLMEVGQTFKNYIEICNYLEEPIKDGNRAKQYQFKNWNRYFTFDKEGHRLIITKVYDQPLPKEDKRTIGNNAKYIQFIECILIACLMKHDNYSYATTKKRWFSLLGLINEKYIDKKKHYEILIGSISNLNQKDINDFFIRVSHKLDQIFFTSLNNLKKRNIIDWIEEVVIIEANQKKIGFDNEDQFIRLADKAELKVIEEAKKIILNNMGYEKFMDALFKNKEEEFYRMIDEYLIINFGWRFFLQYRITSKNCVNISGLEVQQNKLEFNKMVLNAIDKQAEDRLKKNKDKVKKKKQELIEKIGGSIWGSPFLRPQDIGVYVFKEDYIEISKALSDYYIKIE